MLSEKQPEHETRVEIELTHIGKRAAWVSHGITVPNFSPIKRLPQARLPPKLLDPKPVPRESFPLRVFNHMFASKTQQQDLSS